MSTPLSSRDLLEYTVRLIHPEKILAQFPGMTDEVVAMMLRTDVATYHAIQAGLLAGVRQAAEETLGDQAFAAQVDRVPFAPGAKVVGFGSSSTDDLQSWFALLQAIFELRRPQDGIHFVNLGISGDATTHEIARFQLVVNERPDWIICHISSNDGRRHGGKSALKPLVSPEETEKNLVMLRQYGAQTDARWIWMTPTRLVEERIAASPLFALSQVMFYNADSARVAEAVLKQPDPAVNLWELFGDPTDPELVSWDGLHPSLKGYQRILQVLIRDLVQHFA